MGILGGLVMGLFVYVGARYMIPTLITGTTSGEQIATNLIPFVLACIVVGIVASIFRA